MGLLMAQLAPRAGAASVTVINVNQTLSVAAEVGIERRYEHGDADRAEWDVVIDCTGSYRRDDGLPRVGRRVPALRRGARRRHWPATRDPGIS